MSANVEMANLVTITAGARQHDMAPNTLRYHIRRGRVETVMTPLGRLVVRESLETFFRDRAEEAKGTPERS